MSRYIDIPCPEAPANDDAKRLTGTRWLHNPQAKKWYMVRSCTVCGQVHMPDHIRPDRLDFARS